MSAYVYDKTYHDYAIRISRASAEQITRLLKSFLSVESVLDVGCSSGTWLSVWRNDGLGDYIGIDGEYGAPQTLVIDRAHFIAHDLSKPFSLGRTFDLVQCLEVAEHLPSERGEGLVAELAAHGPIILFSAAPPGQGGEQHVNERPYAYWRDLFAERGYALIDCLRPALRGKTDISFWYRYNMFLFIREEKVLGLPPAIRALEIKKDAPIPDVSPWTYRVRKAIVRRLPFVLCQVLAKAKARTA